MHRPNTERKRAVPNPYILDLSHYNLTLYQGLTYLLIASRRKGILLKDLAQVLSLKIPKTRELVRVLQRHGLITANGRIRALKPRLNEMDTLSEALDNVIYLLRLPHRR